MNDRTILLASFALLVCACSAASEPGPEPEPLIIITTDGDSAVGESEFVEPEPVSDDCIDTLRPEIVAATGGRRVHTGDAIDVGSVLRFTAHDASQPRWTLLRDGAPSSIVDDEELTVELTEAGRYDVQLTVAEEACQASDFFTLTGVPPHAVDEPGVVVELQWDTPGDPDPTDTITGDLDLHYRREGGEWHQQPLDCYPENKGPDWGPAGRVGNPRLSASAVSPERVTHPAPEATFYDVAVQYRDDRGYGESIATLRIWFDGVMVQEATQTLQPGEFWVAATIWGGNGSVVEAGSQTSDP